MVLSITQINLQHSKSSSYLIEKRIQCCSTNKNQQQQQIFLIQEPWIGGDVVIRGLPTKYGNIFVKHNSGRPRTCIFATKNTSCRIINELSSNDITAVIVDIKQNGLCNEILFISAYFPYDSAEEPPTREFINAVEYAKRNNLQLIAGCDANSHHTCWGSTDTNSRGIALLEWLSSTNLTIANDGDKPTFVTSRRQEVIDLTLVSNRLVDKVKNWRVLEEESLSDHRYIAFIVNGDFPGTGKFRNPKKTNWDRYKAYLSETLHESAMKIRTYAGLDQAALYLERAISEAYEKSCPFSHPKQTGTPWWNRELERHRKWSRKLLHKAQRAQKRGLANHVTAWELYHSAQRDYKNCVRKAKRASWKKLCEETNNLTATAKLKKALTKDRSTSIGSLERPDGSYTQNNLETLTHLMDIHFPENTTMVSHEEVTTQMRKPDRNDWKIAARVVTRNKIDWSINSFSKFKSPGPDGIFPGLLQEGLNILMEHLFNLFRGCLAFGYIPACWRRVKVVFIPKPGKNNYHYAKSFRPISLTSFLIKCLERLVDRYFRDYPLKQHPLHINQHAYQKGKSVDTALHEMTYRIEKALEQGEFSLGAMLDIEGAFDNATFDSMCTAAQKHGLEPTLTRWINSMLINRNITANLGVVSHTVVASRGCPQGGVISPLLWCLVVDELLVLLNEKGFYTQGYADDIAIVLVGKFTDTIFDRMQEGLNIVNSWCTGKGLSVNPKKTELILFTRRRNTGSFKLPKVEEQTLALSREVKYLGVYLDSKLLFQKHIQEKCARATRIYWQCRCAFGKIWGLQPKYVYWIYTQIIRPIVTFAAIVWWPRVEKGTGLKPLISLQRMACLGITGVVKTTPTAALEIALNILPIDLWTKKCAANSFIRMRAAGTLNKTGIYSCKGHLRIWKEVNSIDSVHMPLDYKTSTYMFDRTFTTKLTEREAWLDHYPDFMEPESMKIFTDGSVMEGLAGAGTFCLEPEVKVFNSLGKHATVFQSEVYAIITAALLVKEGCTRDTVVYICSDSQAAIKAISSYTVSSYLVEECIAKLNQIGRLNKVTIVWVPSHQGIIGNEIADSLARDGSSNPIIGPEPGFLVSMANVKNNIEDFFNSLHNTRWCKLNSCRTSKTTMNGRDTQRSKFFLGLDRKTLRTLLGVLTGHGHLNHHLHKMKIRSSATCDLCLDEDETVEHFLCSCPRLNGQRLQSFGSHILPEDLVGELKIPNILDFIKRTKRFED